MKKPSKVLKILVLAAFGFSSALGFAANELTFGQGKGKSTSALLHIFVNKQEAAPNCGANCIRFSVLIDDQGVSNLVTVIADHTKSENLSMTSYALKPREGEHLKDGTTLTSQMSYELPISSTTRIDDVVFRVVTFKPAASNSKDDHKEEYNDVIKVKFKGSDVKNLEPVNPMELR